MKLLVLCTLKWRMQSVTPFSFIEYFLGKLYIDQRCLFPQASQLIISATKVRSRCGSTLAVVAPLRITPLFTSGGGCLMQAKSEKLPWNLQIKSQAKHFGFSFKLRLNATPESLHRFSLLLKLRKWRIRVKSESGSPAIKTELLKRNGSIKSKFVRIFQKLRSRLRIKGRPAPQSAKFAVARSRLMKCGAFLAIAVLASAFGFDVTKLVESAMKS